MACPVLMVLACAGPQPAPAGSPDRPLVPPIETAAPEKTAPTTPSAVVPLGAPAAPRENPDPPPPAEQRWLRLRFVGDVIFGRYRDGAYQPLADPDDPVFGPIAPLLEGDLAIANLETPLLPQIPRTNARPGYFFGATPDMARKLADAGFHAVSLANNHAADLGIAGLRQTPVLLRELGIEPLGAAREAGTPLEVQTVDVGGSRLAMLSVTARSNFELPPQAPNVAFVAEKDLARVLGPLVSSSRARHDLVVVLVHWGVEYARYPEAVQRAAARALVDAGADLVIGHHPHVLQEVELYRNGVIAYSLGNFLFGNTEPEPKLTGVLAVDVERSGACRRRVRFDPAVIRRFPFVHPEPSTESNAHSARRRILPREPEQRARWQREGEALVAEVVPATCPPAL